MAQKNPALSVRRGPGGDCLALIALGSDHASTAELHTRPHRLSRGRQHMHMHMAMDERIIDTKNEEGPGRQPPGTLPSGLAVGDPDAIAINRRGAHEARATIL